MTAERGSARSVLGAGAAVGTARVFSLVCAAVQLPLLTALLTPAEYSLVALAIAVSTYFSLVTAEPMILAFQRYPGSRDDRGTYRYALTRSSAALLGFGIAIVAVAIFIGEWRTALAIVGWGIGMAVTRLVSTAWLMWADPWRYAVNLMVSTGVRTAGLVGLIVVGVEGALAIAIAGVASALATLALSPKVRGVIAPRRPPWTWQFGMHLAAASLAVTVLTSASLVMLPAFVSKTEVGRFAAMTQIATLTCGAVLGLILTVAYPALRRLWDDGHRAVATTRLAFLAEVCLGCALGAIAVFTFGNFWIVRLVVGTDYLDGAIIPALTLGTALASMGQLSGWYHQFQFEAAVVSRRTWIAAVAGVVITAAGAWVLGTTGAAAGVTLGFLVYFLLLQWRTGLTPRLAYGAVAATAGCLLAALVPGELAEWLVCACSGIGAIVILGHLMWRLRAKRI
ncbi:hypothetical protein [Leifsonia sp. NPDC080035]|uniref:Polysaccharide biosynthesis protein n=1 Tax=Leifsonia sp. NPDC080035 TaxID=3143936 RepID=A0AAU7GEG7_9MICO